MCVPSEDGEVAGTLRGQLFVTAKVAEQVGRVRVACQTCSERKVKCDGRRPCLPCMDRDVADACRDRPRSVRSKTITKRPPTYRACLPCATSKVACEDERPCSRCIRLEQRNACVIKPFVVVQVIDVIPRATNAILMNPLTTEVCIPSEIREIYRHGFLCVPRTSLIAVAASPSRMYVLQSCLACFLELDEMSMVSSRIQSVARSYAESKPDDFYFSDEKINVMEPFVLVSSTSEKYIQKFPDAPHLSYKINERGWTRAEKAIVEMNHSAQKAFGYSKDDLARALMSSVHCFDMNGHRIPFYFKFFHRNSWPRIAAIHIQYLFNPQVTYRTRVQILRCDGVPVSSTIYFQGQKPATSESYTVDLWLDLDDTVPLIVI